MKPLRLLVVLVGLVSTASTLFAQSTCSSDGQRPPTQVQERFINADCAACWSQQPPALPAGSLALDWITPGALGEAAPLSIAATSDALARLGALGRSLPPATDSVAHALSLPAQHALHGARLRVAHGLPFSSHSGGYVGASMALLLPVNSRNPLAGRDIGALKATLALVETIPAGVDGTPVERNLVRNSVETVWDGRAVHPILAQPRRSGSEAQGGRREPGAQFYASQVMSIPEGARPERLRVVGWVEDASASWLLAAQTRCKP